MGILVVCVFRKQKYFYCCPSFLILFLFFSLLWLCWRVFWFMLACLCTFFRLCFFSVVFLYILLFQFIFLPCPFTKHVAPYAVNEFQFNFLRLPSLELSPLFENFSFATFLRLWISNILVLGESPSEVRRIYFILMLLFPSYPLLVQSQQ